MTPSPTWNVVAHRHTDAHGMDYWAWVLPPA